jgi:hypothetical protein
MSRIVLTSLVLGFKKGDVFEASAATTGSLTLSAS